MGRAPGRHHEDSGYLGLGVDEPQEEPNTKPTEVSGIATSAAVEEESGSEPESAAAAAAAEQGQVGVGAPDPMVDEIQKGGGGDGDGDEEEFPQEPPMQADAEDPQPSDRQPRFHGCPFHRLHLKELESIFQRSRYPNVFARKALSSRSDGSKARGQFSKPDNNNL